ncbi:MAG: hypothetical protein AAF456_22370 [Planctomycetota bacterium]
MNLDGGLIDRLLTTAGQSTQQPQLFSPKVTRVYGASSQPYNLRSIIDFVQRPVRNPNAVAGGIDIGSAPTPGSEFEIDFEKPETPVPDGSENDLTVPAAGTSGQGERRIGARAVTPDQYRTDSQPEHDPQRAGSRSLSATSGQRPDELDVDPRPFEYFIRFIFTDEESARQVFEHYKKEVFTEEDSVGGVVLFRPADYSQQIRMWMPDAMTVEFGTRLYLTQSTRQVFTDRLMEQFSALPNASIRAVWDLGAARQMVSRIKTWVGTEQVEKHQWLFRLLDNSVAMRLSLDTGGGMMAGLTATAEHRNDTDSVERGMNRVVNELNSALMPPRNETIEDYVPGLSGVLLQTLASTTPQKLDSEVSISVSKPRDFDQQLSAIFSSGQYGGAVERQFEIAWKSKTMQTAFEEIAQYEARNHRLPFFVDDDHNERLSWRARVGQRETVFELSEPWDSPDNALHIETIPLHYQILHYQIENQIENSPDEQMEESADEQGTTDICRVVHSAGPERTSDVRSPREKILLLQHPTGVAWTQNADIPAESVLQIKNSLGEDQWLIAVMYDGSCRTITSRLSDRELQKMLDWKNR